MPDGFSKTMLAHLFVEAAASFFETFNHGIKIRHAAEILKVVSNKRQTAIRRAGKSVFNLLKKEEFRIVLRERWQTMRVLAERRRKIFSAFDRETADEDRERRFVGDRSLIDRTVMVQRVFIDVAKACDFCDIARENPR